jgi:hypothetical protein
MWWLGTCKWCKVESLKILTTNDRNWDRCFKINHSDPICRQCTFVGKQGHGYLHLPHSEWIHLVNVHWNHDTGCPRSFIAEGMPPFRRAPPQSRQRLKLLKGGRAVYCYWSGALLPWTVCPFMRKWRPSHDHADVILTPSIGVLHPWHWDSPITELRGGQVMTPISDRG